MLDWLYGVVYTIFGSISGAVKDFVHSVVRGLIGALNAVAGRMWSAWWEMVAIMRVAGGVFLWFCGGVYHALAWLMNDFVSFVTSSIGGIYHVIFNTAKRLAAQIVQAVTDLAATAWRWVQDAIGWIVQNIYTPLANAVADLVDKMTRWAYTAWFYVTHPDALAQVIFWALWGVFARNAYSVARYVGEWALRLILTQTISSVQLVEQIVSDVL